MAELYLAVEQTDSARRFVTVKRIRADFAHEAEFVEFFHTEARVAMRCSHPNLPQVIDAGRVDGMDYLAMEFIQGHTMLEMLRAAIRLRRWITPTTVVSVGVHVAAALEHVHGLRDVDGSLLNVIHRDVTPQNIMLTSAGSVKLIDFGIVRSAVQTHRTKAGVIKGKFSYMAPEQLAEVPLIDQRADIFSLGIVLHEALCGRSLFRAATDFATCERVLAAPIPDPSEVRSDVPRELAALVLKALSRDPARRFQTATDMLSALEYVAERCHLAPSVVRLRDEMTQLCGEAVAPTVEASVLASLPGGSRDKRPQTDEIGPDDDNQGNTGLSKDPLLMYFLKQGAADKNID